MASDKAARKANWTAQTTRTGLLFKQAIKSLPPSEYAQHIAAGIQEGLFTPAQALILPLIMGRSALSQLPHKSEVDDTPRDARLIAWFDACEHNGANAATALSELTQASPNAPTRACSQWLRMKAFDTLAWWRECGIEKYLLWPDVAGAPRLRINITTISLLEGQIELAQRFGQPIPAPCLDKLWETLWQIDLLKQLPETVRFLEAQGPVPEHALRGLRKASINKRNIDTVLSVADHLVAQGIDPLAGAGKPALAEALNWFRAPATVRVIEFLIAHGADPLQCCHNGPDAPSIVQVALHKWLDAHPRTQLRPFFGQAFALMAQATPTPEFLALFPQDALVELAGKYPDRFPLVERMLLERRTAVPQAIARAPRPRL